jgi:hypothetical protein
MIRPTSAIGTAHTSTNTVTTTVKLVLARAGPDMAEA